MNPIVAWWRDISGQTAVAAANARAASEAAAARRQNAEITARLNEWLDLRDDAKREARESLRELAEAAAMAGAGPWRVSPALIEQTNGILDRGYAALSGAAPTGLREAISNQGAFGDIELALQNVDWRREINLSWLEFSRWGIQQIVLISRLYYLKNPIVRRLLNVCAEYVFARGVEISSPDEGVNAAIQRFIAANRGTLGKVALMDLERRKDYDGNLFFALFADEVNTGEVLVRTIDATEMQEIISDPDDADVAQYFRRQWTQQDLDIASGQVRMTPQEAWYPSIYFEPDIRPAAIGGKPVVWATRIHHRRCGGVAKWRWGCPRIYPAIDWAKASKRFLEACATLRMALAQFAWSIKTKGGQQAVEGIKQQLQTTVNTQGSSLWDTNPTPVNASVFASGPSTQLEAVKTAGSGGNPEEVRQFKLMCCMVKGVPETFLGDVSTGNLATATSLDRPTETAMLALQEEWIEDLEILTRYAVRVNMGAPGGMLREAARAGLRADEVEIRVEFPAIREGDIPALVSATVEAMTLGDKSGAIHGVDAKAGARKLGDLLGLPNNDETVENQYPEGSYVIDRTLPDTPPAPSSDPAIAQAAEAMRMAAAELRGA